MMRQPAAAPWRNLDKSGLDDAHGLLGQFIEKVGSFQRKPRAASGADSDIW